jgi:hypothetical protein
MVLYLIILKLQKSGAGKKELQMIFYLRELTYTEGIAQN